MWADLFGLLDCNGVDFLGCLHAYGWDSRVPCPLVASDSSPRRPPTKECFPRAGPAGRSELGQVNGS